MARSVKSTFILFILLSCLNYLITAPTVLKDVVTQYLWDKATCCVVKRLNHYTLVMVSGLFVTVHSLAQCTQ